MKSRERTWIEQTMNGRKETIFAVQFEAFGKQHPYDHAGSYLHVSGGFQPQHRRTKVHTKEVEARRDVLGHAISIRQKEITKLQRELDKLSLEPNDQPPQGGRVG